MIKKRIEEFPDYEISTCGRFFKEGKELKVQVNIDGYYVINLQKDGKSYHRRRARLLALTFIPNPDNLPVVNHIDHTRTNDSLDNLEWVSYKENSRKSVELCPDRWKAKAEIDEVKARDICIMIHEGYRNKEIVDKLGVTQDIVKHIRKGDTWTEISKDYKMQSSKKSISEETAKWVCYRIKEGLSNSEILEQTVCNNLSRSIIKHIRYGKSWSKISKGIF